LANAGTWKQTDLPPDLKKKIEDVKPVLVSLASTDWIAQGNTTKENIDKIASVYKEVNNFISKKCDEALKNIETESYNYKNNPFFFAMYTYMEILPVGIIITLISALVLKKKMK